MNGVNIEQQKCRFVQIRARAHSLTYLPMCLVCNIPNTCVLSAKWFND